MNKTSKSLALLLLLLTSFILPFAAVNATYTASDAIDGYVTLNGSPVEGIEVYVFRVATSSLEGYGWGHNGEADWLGKGVTDVNGYFKVAWLYAHGEQYRVEAHTPCGIKTVYVNVLCGETVRVNFCCVGPGTGTPGYWKNHPEAWPVDSITIGGVTYTKNEAINEMWEDKRKDKTYTMFGALVAAKLNVMIGNEDSCVADTIVAADEWMATYGPVGSGVRGNSDAWKEGEPLYWILDDYNNGLLCAPPRD